MKVSIVGSRGRIGSALKDKIIQNGHEITGEFNRGESPDPEILSRSDATILAVPIEDAKLIIENHGSQSRMIELSSIKVPMKKFSNGIISIHPLFGPASYSNPKFSTILFINDISESGSLDLIRNLFTTNQIVSVTAEEHDRAMADLLVAPYLISILAKRVLAAERKYATPSYTNLQKVASLLDGENPSVVGDTIALNEFTGSVIGQIEEELNRIRGDLN